MVSIFQKIWSGWKKFAKMLGRAQVILILTLLYIIVFIPLGIFYRLVRLCNNRSIDSTWKNYHLPEDPDHYFRRQG